MPVAGRKPKPEGEAVNRNQKAYDWTEIPDVPFTGAPPLPAKMPNGLTWPASTRKWWRAITTMPHCVLWSGSDWQYAMDSAYVVGLFHLTGQSGHAAEVRSREKVMGTTVDYRRDLRIKYVEPKDPTPVSDDERVTNISDYRDL